MTKKQERHIIASAGTALFMLAVFLILWFVYLTAVAPEEDEGVEIEFAEIDVDELAEASAAAYAEEPSEAAPEAPASPAPEVATSPEPASPDENIISEEETLALERARKEREEREAAERARKEKEAAAIAKANAMGSLFGKTEGTSAGGDSEGDKQKGNPVGHGSSGGNSWSLDGRGLKGTLPKPLNTFKQEGKVVVQIRVNAAGQVIDVRETIGSTISDKSTIQLALDAARKAKFTEGKQDQIGTITYIFKLN